MLAPSTSFDFAAADLTAGESSHSECQPSETLLGCDLRIAQPGWAVVLFGTNEVTISPDILHGDTLPGFCRAWADRPPVGRGGTVPILSTIPPRLQPIEEGWTERFNAALCRLARDRRVPIINLWRAMSGLAQPRAVGGQPPPQSLRRPECTGYCDPQTCAPTCQAGNLTAAGRKFGYDVRNLVTLERNLVTLETLARLRAKVSGRAALAGSAWNA